MNYFTKNKWWAVAVAVLCVANIITLIIFWTVKAIPIGQPLTPNAPQQPGQPASFLINELKFDATQQKQFEQLRNEHQQQVKSVRDSLRIAKDAFYNLLKSASVSDVELEALSGKAGQYQQKLDLITFTHFKKVRAICTPQQQEKFDEVIQQVVRQMAPPPHPRAPQRPGDMSDDRPPPPPPGNGPPEN